MNKLRKILASVLSLVMVISMFPGAALAAEVGALPSADYVTAEFVKPELQLDDAGQLASGDRTATIEVTPSTSMTALKAYRAIIDWRELKDYTEKVFVYIGGTNRNPVSQGGFPTSFNGPGSVNASSSSIGEYPEGTTYASYATTSGTVNPNGNVMLSVDIDMVAEVPAGTYTVPIRFFELNENNEFTIDPFQQSEWAVVEAVLTITDASGNIPEPPVQPTTYHISTELYPAGSANGTLTASATDAEYGDVITLTATPAANYKVKEVKLIVGTAETVLGGEDVVDGTGAPTGAKTYNFGMPASDVTARAEFELIQADDTDDEAYAINIQSGIEHGSIQCELHEANEGVVITFQVLPDTDYEPESVRVVAATNVDVSVAQVGEADTLTGAYTYSFTMPNSDVTLRAQMKLKNDSGSGNQGDDNVAAGYLHISGSVVTSNGKALEGAEVRLVYVDGANPGTIAATTMSDAEGQYVFSPDVSNSYKYTVEAFFDTGIQQGHAANPGQIVSSGTKEVSKSTNNTDNHGESIVAALTITLYYDWDLDNDGAEERVYAGPDDEFMTTDDFYKKDIKDNQGNLVRNVDVFADANGQIQSTEAYFMWEVDDDGIKEPVYVGNGFRAGTPQNYYYFDVDHGAVDSNGNPTADVKVYVGPDQIPATADDNYVMDVNGDGTPDTVVAGPDGKIATADDWYNVGDTVVHAGEDMVAGTADDWYAEDTDHNGILDGPGNSEQEMVFVGTERLPHTNDDFYVEDVNGDGIDETVYAGPFPTSTSQGGDATFNTADDFYEAVVDSSTVKVYPGATGDQNDPYEFGRDNDHYDWSVDGIGVSVRVGEDRIAGTEDDNYDFEINGETVVVFAGEDGIPGNEDDWYEINAYGADDELEKVFCGEDGVLGTADDYYIKDVNGDGEDEQVFAGEDKQFNTADDNYFTEVGGETVNVVSNDETIGNAGDSYQFEVGGEDTQVFVGEDGIAAGDADDDYYLATVTDKNDEEVEVQVFIGEDKTPGTADDHYSLDADADDDAEECFNGEDGIPGTADDFYEEDVNGDGEDEQVFAGEDEAFDTADDFYEDEIDGTDIDVFAGEDAHIGSADDTYAWTVPTEDGEEEIDARVGEDLQAGTPDDEYDATVPVGDGEEADVIIFAGDDGILGTDDDWYALDADGDGEDEEVNVGEDCIPGTADDNYIKDVNGDGEDEQVFAGEDKTFDTSDDHYFDDIEGTEIDVFAGEDGDIGTADDTYKYTDDNDIEHDMFVGEDKDPGTADDYYLQDVDGDGEDEEILNGSGVPGDSGDHYFMNADDDQEDEDCHVGNDGIPGTADDYYVEDVNGDGANETVFAGEDEDFGTCDDYYQALVRDPDGEGDAIVPIYAGEDEHFSEPDDPNNDDWFPGDTNGDGVVDPAIYDGDDTHDKIFVDGDTFPDNSDDFYIADVDGDGEDEIVNVGEDGRPLTNDDNYTKDVNGDGEDETVYAGPEDGDGHFGSPENPSSDDFYNDEVGDQDVQVSAGDDGLIGTADDEYDYDINGDGEDNDPTMYVGDDETPGTEDDYYLADPDSDGEPEPVYAGEDGIPGTEDDWFPIDDIDGDGEDEIGHVGDDGLPNTGDEFYDADPDQDGEIEPINFGDDGKPGTEDDYYEYDADHDGEDEPVYAGEDGIPGTADDTYPVDDVDGDGEDELGHVGEDGIPGTDDDYYDYDADHDGEDEPVDFGEDGKPGTADDTYPVDDVDGDGEDELGHVGEDGIPGTDDDYYDYDADHDGEDEPVDFGEDGKPGTSDDTYPVDDVDGDGEDELGHVGEDGIPGTDDDYFDYDADNDGEDEPVDYGEDGKPGTPDDTYPVDDIDGDGEDELGHVGEDGIPGTDDDYYDADPDGDGEVEPVDYGEDGKPGTEDDTYPVDDVDGDGIDETGHVGEDGIPGTEDDWYDCSDPDSPDPIHAGEDGKPGTPDDWYEEDVDDDGEDEVVYVGDDCKPHTDDDWYYADITFDANGGKVEDKDSIKLIQSAIKELPSATRSSYTFKGWTLQKNSGAILTLDEILALKVDTTVYASWSYNGGGGWGGGGGGGTTYYTVTFESNGGSAVSSQSIASGNKVTKPADPTKDGFTFLGWFSDKDCKEAYDFNAKVSKSMTLYAGWRENTVQENVFGLLTSDHVDYVDGYPSGSVGPNDTLTRAQAAMIFYRLLNKDARAKYATKIESFDDVPADVWYTEAVATLQNAGIIVGYGNGKFGPNDNITRAQFAVICARIGKLQFSGTKSFTDVAQSHWAYRDIIAAAENGWVAGYGDGRFGPDDNITRAQAIALLNRVLARDGITEESIKAMMSDPDFQNFSDNQNSSAWFYLDIIEAANGHDYKVENGVETWTDLLP